MHKVHIRPVVTAITCNRSLEELQPNLFVGPEVTLAGRMEFDESWAGYEQWRAGPFIAGLRMGTFLLGFSAGYAHDRQQGNRGYVSTSARVAF